MIGGGKSGIDLAIESKKAGASEVTLLRRNAHWPTPRKIAWLIPFQFIFLSRFGQVEKLHTLEPLSQISFWNRRQYDYDCAFSMRYYNYNYNYKYKYDYFSDNIIIVVGGCPPRKLPPVLRCYEAVPGHRRARDEWRLYHSGKYIPIYRPLIRIVDRKSFCFFFLYSNCFLVSAWVF